MRLTTRFLLCLVTTYFWLVPPLAAEPADSLNDGPHVIWPNDSTIVVVYYCNEQLIKQPMSITGDVSYNGLCDDSLTQYTISPEPFAVPAERYTTEAPICIVSDIHGEFQHFVNVLTASGVIDDKLHWKYGDGHLVIDGDVFDRGDRVTECLWLIYCLEQEAAKVGGLVHMLLGNHELMVLQGDDRYINDKYLQGIARKSRIKHEELYGVDSHLGRWLRSKNTVEIINDMLFVHGGLSPALIDSGYTIASVNQAARAAIDLRSSQLIFNDSARFIFGSLGPFWYRGYHYEMEGRYPQASSADIDRLLAYYDARSIVVGHTGVDTIAALYNGQVIAVDMDVEALGCLQALVWQDNRLYRVSGNGGKSEL